MVETLRLKLKEQKGFTLIELLAVIVILGIIAAIAIPAIGNVISKSKDHAKVAEALQILDAAKLAYNDLDPTAAAAAGVTTIPASPTTTTVTSVTWTQAGLGKYLSKVKDKAFTVTYTPATNVYTITGHDAADTITTESVEGTLTEDELAELAR
jgi:type IV pilus assembly protein PilA